MLNYFRRIIQEPLPLLLHVKSEHDIFGFIYTLPKKIVIDKERIVSWVHCTLNPPIRVPERKRPSDNTEN